MNAAGAVLARLLVRAEAARQRGDGKPGTLAMTSARDAGEYLRLPALADVEVFHAHIALAEREGAIAVEWERLRDDPRLRLLTVADLGVLARHLGGQSLADRVAAARTLLAPWRAAFPVLDAVLARWAKGKSLRGRGPEAATELADAARAVQARQADAGQERILRRESARLFGDSKRLEALTPWLERLVTGECAASGLEKAHVWAALGLRREPQPMLVAGRGSVRLDGDAVVSLVRPYLGLPVEAVRGFALAADAVLTVENLASFHDAASQPEARSLLLVYTGGMPSPAWRAAFARLLADLPEATPLYHWGDIDLGGFRIAAQLAALASAAGRRLQPWCMVPASVPTEVADAAKIPSAATLAAMADWATRAGWPAVANALRSRPLVLEQEALPARLPVI